jgi:hypothetical protein
VPEFQDRLGIISFLTGAKESKNGLFGRIPRKQLRMLLFQGHHFLIESLVDPFEIPSIALVSLIGVSFSTHRDAVLASQGTEIKLEGGRWSRPNARYVHFLTQTIVDVSFDQQDPHCSGTILSETRKPRCAFRSPS